MDSKYYDGTKLLSLKDINGNLPEIYIAESNRTDGKSTYFNNLELKRYKKEQKKFMLLYRHIAEIDNISEKFFGDESKGLKSISDFGYTGDTMTEKYRENKMFSELIFNGESCGYAVALNSANKIKKMSHFFNDVDSMLFDEMQPEDNRYLKDEVGKLLSIHTSVSRGQGKQVRRVPLYICTNRVSLLNPYYVSLGVSKRLTPNTNFLRGDGWVLQSTVNESARKAQESSAFNRAFKKHNYTKYSAEKIYLNDNACFVEKLSGDNRYILTVKHGDKFFSVKEFVSQGFLYCDTSYDSTHKFIVSVDVDSHDIQSTLINKNSMYIKTMRSFFESGRFRFRDLECKEVIFSLLSY